jgi:acyl-CoA synthetase (AMP-forming)/AMP-acid ligase II
MPRNVLERLRDRLPKSDVYLMYGLTEAFRATYLPPDMVDERPDSIGKAIPNAEIIVLREDGSRCEPGETGELVQRGALVALGYWNQPELTAERFRPLPVQSSVRPPGLQTEELGVFSGDLVRADTEGFLYFVSRKDEMLKTSGYRVSPTEVEEILYSSGLVAECAAFGIPDAELGQRIGAAVKPRSVGDLDMDALLTHCKQMMPTYMVPFRIEVVRNDLPRNQNGKIDRKAIALQYTEVSEEAARV